MKAFLGTVIGALLIGVATTAWADDPASFFIVRDQGYGAIGLELSAEQQRQTDTVTFGRFFAGTSTETYHYKTQEAIISGTLGVGYGFELFLDVPNTFQHQTTGNGVDEHLPSGFGDADFGFKYRLLGSAATADRLVLRADFTHHSSSVGSDQLALYYAHVFSPGWTVGVQAFYEYDELGTALNQHYQANQYGGTGLLFWNVAPKTTLIPFVRVYNTESYDTVPAAITSQLGLEASYYWSRAWSVTPTLSYLHTETGRETINSFVSVNYGVRNGGLATVLLQYQF